MQKLQNFGKNYRRRMLLLMFFVPITLLFFFLVDRLYPEDTAVWSLQKTVYTLVFSVLLGGLLTGWLSLQIRDTDRPKPKHGVLYYPLLSALLALIAMSLCYVYLGVWPIGNKSVMTVDMHHQYAPLLNKLREMLLNGGSPLYTFETGLGVSFLPMFGYYLASPLNLILALFPESLLTEGILVVTLLKNALAAFCFALCVQSIHHRRDVCIPVLSVAYSLMMYLLAYSWNIMWLDCVAILPLVILFFERMMRTGKFLGYTLSLAYALFTNYYIGFMLCVFLVLYYIVYAMRRRRSIGSHAKSFLRFAVSSALAGGLVMFLLLPIYFGLGNTSAAGGGIPKDVTANFDIFELLGRHLYVTSPTIRSRNLPNIYCGLLSVFLLPLFATLKSIPLRRRIAYLGLLSVLAISMTLNVPDLLWHGLHSPNDLPYRYSFLYSFVLLLIAYEALIHIRELSFKQVGGSFLGILIYLVIEQRFGDEEYGFATIFFSLLFVLIYGVIVGIASRRPSWTRPAYALLLLAVIVEMTTNGGITLRAINSTEYFTNHDAYVDNDTTKVVRAAVKKTQAIGDAATGGAFYRMESLPRRTTVDTALFNFRGISIFSSSNYYATTKFMGNVGYAINGVNSHLYNSFVAPIDSLLGIRYLTLESNIANHPQLKQLDSVSVNSASKYIYENPYALPVGYMVGSAIKEWNPAAYNPFQSQNTMFTAMTGIEDPMYIFHTVQVKEESAGIAAIHQNNGHTFNLNPGTSKTANFEVPIDRAGQVFIYLDCRAATDLSARVGSSSWKVTTYEPYIIDAGALNVGDTVSVSVTADNACSGNIYVVSLNEAVFEESMQLLKAGGLEVSSFNDREIKGTVHAEKGGTLFTSIPYDEGWQVKVDGKAVKTFAACDAMVAFDLKAGTHTVELCFTPKGLIPGILISLVSLGAILALVLAAKRGKTFFSDPKALPAPVAELPCEEAASEELPPEAELSPEAESQPETDLPPEAEPAPEAEPQPETDLPPEAEPAPETPLSEEAPSPDDPA